MNDLASNMRLVVALDIYKSLLPAVQGNFEHGASEAIIRVHVDEAARVALIAADAWLESASAASTRGENGQG